MRRLASVLSVVWLVAALAGCGGDDDGAPPTATTEPGVAVPEGAVPERTLPGPGEPWDVLFLAADYFYPVAVADMYAEHASEALGVEVNAEYPLGQINYASYLVKHLRNDRIPKLGDRVQEAEIVVLFPRIDDTQLVGKNSETAHIHADYLRCTWDISTEFDDGRPIGGDAGQPGTPPSFDGSADYWEPYRERLDEIYAEIWDLRRGPTVIITLDWMNSWLPHQREAGIESECSVWWESWSTQHREAAAAHGSTVVSVYDLFNGADHDVDPGEIGYVGPTGDEPDLLWYVPNQTGLTLMAEAIAAAGFEPVAAP